MTLTDKLASALRTYGRCLCQTKAFWPWRKEYRCGMCLALTDYDLHKAAAQSLAEAAEKGK